RLASDVYQYVHLIKIQNGKLDIRVESEARKEFVGELRDALSRLTGTRWNVILGNEAGSPTLAQQKEAAQQALRDQAAKHPVVAEVLRLFPGTEISVRMDAEAPEKDKP
ncbi:MAG TPA: DNA polymerase III subunit gamma/tau, partial [Patescibacteria group bacterium]|nr:DNA polymerase III subunit gamma/tau [Patescibacteria group bacterium]